MFSRQADIGFAAFLSVLLFDTGYHRLLHASRRRINRLTLRRFRMATPLPIRRHFDLP